MIDINQLSTINIYGKIAIYAIFIISLIHFIGFINLEKWLEFSGIGDPANSMKQKYGYWSIAVLNLSAAFLFILIPIGYYKAIQSGFSEIALFIGMVFLLRGIGGLFFTFINLHGSATKEWEIVFSVLSGVLGVLLLLGVLF